MKHDKKKGPATRMNRRRLRAGRTGEADIAMRRSAGRKRAPTLEEMAAPHSHSSEPDEA